ncbi:MAG: M949_RS01915 family surface polysaccharide biosynthesis protein [Bacteroidota bacterium]
MRSVFIVGFVLATIPALIAQPYDRLKQGINIPGKVVATEEYTDAGGENVVVLSSTGVYYDLWRSHEADGYLWNNGREVILYAFGYRMKGGMPELVWQMEASILDCAEDIETEFYRDAVHLTNLDKDGVKEIWIMYREGCQAAPGPQGLHLLMVEGNTKHAMDGRTRYKTPNGIVTGGEYKFDAAFRKAPVQMREYAKRMWTAAN